MTTRSGVTDDFPTRLRAVQKLLAERCVGSESGRRAAALLGRLESRFQRPLRIVVLGEANSGKSTLANLLIEHDLLHTDIVRNTHAPVLLRHSVDPRVELIASDGSRCRLHLDNVADLGGKTIARVEVGLPLECLETFELIDTPGLTADEKTVESVRRLCGTAHMAIWCTVAAQAWRASEMVLWRAIGKRFAESSVLAVTCAGSLGQADREKVRTRLERQAGSAFRSLVLVGADRPEKVGRDGDDLRTSVMATIAHVQSERRKRALQIIRRFSDGLTGDGDATGPVMRTAGDGARAGAALAR